MIKSKIRAVMLCVFLALIITSCGTAKGHREVWAAAGQNQPAADAEAGALKDPLPELKKKLPAAADDTEALTGLDDLYKNADSAKERADIVREAGAAARWLLKTLCKRPSPCQTGICVITWPDA